MYLIAPCPLLVSALPSFQLHRPSDEGLLEFWVDFNAGSHSLSLFVEDPSASGGGMWETVVIRTALVAEWTIGGSCGTMATSFSIPYHTFFI